MPGPSSSFQDPAFSGRNLACRRGERLVFARLNFLLPPAGALLLTGPNGSGKSSLLRLMAGLAPAEAGEMLWGTELISDDREAHRQRLHFVGHQDAIKPPLTVRELIGFWGGLRGAPPEDADRALERFRLAELADHPCRFLSAGQKRRLTLARLLASPANLWLLDEPTLGLDIQATADLAAIVKDHRAQGGRIVLSTHNAFDLPDAASLVMSDFAPPRRQAA